MSSNSQHTPPKDSTKLLGEGKKLYHDEPHNHEDKEEKVEGFPRSVFFIVGSEFCERFSYYGMRAVLTLYLHHQLRYDEDTTTVIYHSFTMLCYFTPILGAILADAFLGKYKTILYLGIVYAFGNAVLSMASLPPLFPDLVSKITFSMIGLLLIAFGTGGIKPCVSAFGGDQFHLPRQELQLEKFFSLFYFSINAGSLLSTFITPILRADVSCFNQDCYPLAFSVPAFLMVTALVMFVVGSHMYIKLPAEGSTILDVVKSFVNGVRGMFLRFKRSAKEYQVTPDSELSPDLRRLLKVLILFLPLPLFWALFDQQGSRWTFQATRMDGQLGDWDIKPDQMQIINPLLILVLIPIFENFIYPFCTERGWLVRPLSRMLAGGSLAGVAFLISAILEIGLETTYPVEVVSGEARVTLINTLPCQVNLDAPWLPHNTSLTSLQRQVVEHIKIGESGKSYFNMTVDIDSEECGEVKFILPSYIFTLSQMKAHLVLITADTNIVKVVNIRPSDDYYKSNSGQPKVRVVYNVPVTTLDRCIMLSEKTKNYSFCIEDKPEGFISATPYQELNPGRYDVLVPWDLQKQELNGTQSGKNETKQNITETRDMDTGRNEILVERGAVYNLLVHKSLSNTTNSTISLYEVTPANSIHMLWLVPQYFVITVSEVMFSITGLQFSFTQAPSSMKSVVQAAWLLTVSIGNLIVVIIANAKFFKRQALEFFLFAALMFVDMAVFAVLATRYKYVKEELEEEEKLARPPPINNHQDSSENESKF